MVTLSSLIGGGSFELINRQVFTATGTWTKPVSASDDDIVVVDLWGGGGGGGGRGGGSHNAHGGGHVRHFFRCGSLGASLAATVAAGGLGAAPGNNFGTVGGASSFAGITAGGGGVGTTGSGGGKIYAMPYIKGADYALAGDKWAGANLLASPHAVHGGAMGALIAGQSEWGGGGGGQGLAAAGTALQGGSSNFGGKGGTGSTTTTPPTAGSAPAGGGGCGNSFSGTDSAGGNGGRGEVRVYVVRGGFPTDDFIFEAVV